MSSLRRVPLRPPVVALVVTVGNSPYLGRTLQALWAQTVCPDLCLILNCGSEDNVVLPAGMPPVMGVLVKHIPQAKNISQALQQGVSYVQSPDSPWEVPAEAWLWILHDDSAPAPDCLEALLGSAQVGLSLAVVGPKQLGWSLAHRLLEVGISATATARRLPEIDVAEVDQGQFDSREDVLAVGSAGALISYSVWQELGGFDLALGPFGEGLEFGRRARRAGYRVAVSTNARLYHRRASYYGLRGRGAAETADTAGLEGSTSPEDAAGLEANRFWAAGLRRRPGGDIRRSFRARRTAQLYNWMISVPLWQIPLVTLAIILLAPVRAVARFLTKEPGLAVAEILAPIGLLFKPWAVARARSTIARQAKFPRRILKPLQATSRDILRKKREKRAHVAEIRNSQREQLSPQGRGLRGDLRRKSFQWALALTVILAVLATVLFMPVGWNIRAVNTLAWPEHWADLARVAGQTWVPTGGGVYGYVHPFALVVTGLSAPGALLGLSVAHTLAWWLPLTVVLSGIGAYVAGSLLTVNKIWPRFLLGALWALLPSFFSSIWAGDLGGALIHAALPWVIFAWARAVGATQPLVLDLPAGIETWRPPRNPVTFTGQAAVLLLIIVGARPGMLAIALVAALGLAVFARRGRLWALLSLIPAAVMIAPWAYQAWRADHSGRYFFDGGVGTGLDPGPWWSGVVGVPWKLTGAVNGLASGTTPGENPGGNLVLAWLNQHWAWSWGLAGALILLAATWSVLRLGARLRPVIIGWLVALAAWAVYLYGNKLGLEYVQTSWLPAPTGPWLSAMLAGLLVAGCAGLAQTRPLAQLAVVAPVADQTDKGPVDSVDTAVDDVDAVNTNDAVDAVDGLVSYATTTDEETVPAIDGIDTGAVIDWIDGSDAVDKVDRKSQIDRVDASLAKAKKPRRFVKVSIGIVATLTVLNATCLGVYSSWAKPAPPQVTWVPWQAELSATARQAQHSASAGKALFLRATKQGGIEAELWRYNGHSLFDNSVVKPENPDIEQAIADVYAGYQGGVEKLAAHGIAVVQIPVPPGVENGTDWEENWNKTALGQAYYDLLSRLRARNGLQFVTVNSSGAVLRVDPGYTPCWAWVTEETTATTETDQATGQTTDQITEHTAEATVVSTVRQCLQPGQNNLGNSTQARRLVLAENASRHWQAKLNGKTLAADNGTQQSFAIPAGGGQLTLQYFDESARWYLVATLTLAGLAALAGVPIRRRWAGADS